MRKLGLTALLTAAILAALAASPPSSARADDGLMPPGPDAQKAISFDGKGFLINGRHVYITSGSIHYPRVPRELWRERLLQLKNGGFNTVETYIFWNYHEPREGQIDLTTGEHDIEAFFKLAQELGLFVILRPGPHVCAEWDSGGFPVWLRFKGDMAVRTGDARWLATMDKWFDRLMPIVARYQIHKGGPIILMQLENEYDHSFGGPGWGKDPGGNPYLIHLVEKTDQLGIQIPRFFSGTHHGHDPAGSGRPWGEIQPGSPWDTTKRQNPWMATEFWPGWYNEAGEFTEAKLNLYTRAIGKMMAYGGGGYNAYMFHGGTNFDTWHGHENASSYDYSAAVGQGGDLRTIYYNFRRANLFAQTFAETLGQGDTGAPPEKAPGDVRFTVRKGPAGSIVFLDNAKEQAVETKIEDVPLKVAPHEIWGIVKDAPLAPGIKLDLAAARVLGKTQYGDLTTLVIYGPPGDDAVLKLSSTEGEAKAGSPTVTVEGPKATVKLKFPENGPDLHVATFGKRTLRILAVSTAMADRTWFVNVGTKPYIICGPNYVSEALEKDGKLVVLGTRKAKSDIASALAWGPEEQPRKLALPAPLPAEPAVPPLANWQMRPLTAEAAPAFDDSKWLASAQPVPMGADGDYGAYAWYRSSVTLPEAGECRLEWGAAADFLYVFVNGQYQAMFRHVDPPQNQPADSVDNKGMSLKLAAGKNNIAILAGHAGRNKLWGIHQRIDGIDVKGLTGPVSVLGPAEEKAAVTGWRWKAGKADAAAIKEMTSEKLDTKAAGWADAAVGADVFDKKPGTAWFVAPLPDVPGRKALRFAGVDDHATVFLNGHKLGEHKGWNEPFTLPITGGWKNGGPNTLAILVENTENTGGLSGAVELLGSKRTAVTGWKMSGGIGDADAPSLSWLPCDKPAGTPAFYRATFTATPPADTGPHPVWRVATKELSRGFVWLNGRNLGRYPDRMPVDGVYLPECWLKPGENTIVIFDEEGRAPQKAIIKNDAPAYREFLRLEEVK